MKNKEVAFPKQRGQHIKRSSEVKESMANNLGQVAWLS